VPCLKAQYTTAGTIPVTRLSIRLAIDTIPKEVGITVKRSVIAGGIGGVYGVVGISVGIIFRSPNNGDKAFHKMANPAMLRMKGMIPKTSSIPKVADEKRCFGITLLWQCGHSISLTIFIPHVSNDIFMISF